MKNEKYMVNRLITSFMEYFDRTGQDLVKRIKQDSKESRSELKLNVGGDKLEQKLGKAVDRFIDNIRIFSCFLADLTLYFYNLESLCFHCQTATDNDIILVKNPFLTREVLANMFIDHVFHLDEELMMQDLVQYQSREPNELLQTNIGLILKRKNWEELGLPSDLFDKSMTPNTVSAHESFLSSPREIELMRTSDKNDKEHYCPYDSQPTEDNSQKVHHDNMTESMVFGEEFSIIKENHDISKIQMNNSISLLNQIGEVGPNELFFDELSNETGTNILGLLYQRENKDNLLFSKAIQIFQQIPKVPNPCKKLCLLSSSLSEALKELRVVYSRPDQPKIKVQIELLLSVLIYIIVRSDMKDPITEYTTMKVYFLLDKHYNHNKLVYLMKSAVKSINKAGVFIARKIV